MSPTKTGRTRQKPHSRPYALRSRRRRTRTGRPAPRGRRRPRAQSERFPAPDAPSPSGRDPQPRQGTRAEAQASRQPRDARAAGSRIASLLPLLIGSTNYPGGKRFLTASCLGPAGEAGRGWFLRLAAFQLLSQARESAVQRDVGRISRHVQLFRDPWRRNPDVVHGYELPIAVGQTLERLEQRDALDRRCFGVRIRRAFRSTECCGPHGRARLGDLSTGDADQPVTDVTLARIEVLAVADGALEDVARDVLRVGSRADPIRDVRVNASDQRLGVGKRITAEDHHRLQWRMEPVIVARTYPLTRGPDFTAHDRANLTFVSSARAERPPRLGRDGASPPRVVRTQPTGSSVAPHSRPLRDPRL